MARYWFVLILFLLLPLLACGPLFEGLNENGEAAEVPLPADSPRPPPTPETTPTPITLSGRTYYVGQSNCADAASGDRANPFCTLTTAVNHLQPGDQLVILAGTYHQRLEIRQLAGTAAAPILIAGEDRAQVILDGGCPAFPCGLNDVDWPADEETGLVSIRDSEFVILRQLTVQNSIAVGVDVYQGNDITVQEITVNGMGHAGMLFRHTSHLTVSHNDIGHIQQGWRDENDDPQVGAHEALSIVAVTDFVVANNYVHDGLKEGIDVKESSANGEVHNNRVERTCLVGIYINEARAVRVQRNEVHHSGYFLDENGRTRRCVDVPVYGDFYGDFYGGGILLAVGDLGDLSQGYLADIQVDHNVIWQVVGNGIEFWDELRDTFHGQGEMRANQVSHNVIYETTLAGIRLQDVSDSEIVNNIIALTEEDPITGNAIDDNIVSHNLFWLQYAWQTTAGTQALQGDPLFVNAAGGDFSLQPDSPALDGGLDLGQPYNGTAPDIGAFEFGG